MRARTGVGFLVLIVALAVAESVWAQHGGRLNYRAARVGLDSTVTTNHTLTVAVQDRRSYVLAGDKPEAFVGLMRAGFGIPYDVHTQSGQGLASDVAFALAQAFSVRDVKVGTAQLEPSASREQIVTSVLKLGTSRVLLVTIGAWKTDTYAITRSTSLAYGLFAELLNENGEPIAQNAVTGQEGSQRLLPSDVMGRKLSELLRGPIVTALEQGTAPAAPAQSSSPPSGSLLTQQVHCKVGDAAPQPMARLACSQQDGVIVEQ